MVNVRHAPALKLFQPLTVFDKCGVQGFGRTLRWERVRTMSVDERIGYLLRAACRADGEGNARMADVLRRMAREALPVGEVDALPLEGCP